MRESEDSKVKPKLWMVEKKASERLDEILIERKYSISRKDLLKYLRSNFERLSLRKIKSFQEIILPIQEEILEIVEDNSYSENEVKM